MKKYLFIIIFGVLLCADEITPYISPGIQIGINSSGNFFFSMQITGGIMPSNDAPLALGVTIGKRFYYNNKTNRFDRYTYLDGQASLIFIGIGIGSIGKKTESTLYNQNGVLTKQITQEKYAKFKLWAGSIGLLSYDYITSPSGKHNFGLFGVLPIPFGDFGY